MAGKPKAKPSKAPKPARGLRRGKGLRMKIGNDGTVHVRHMDDNASGGKLALFRGLVELSDAVGTEPKWIQVAKVGSWAGHPAGQFQLTELEFGEVVANFQATTNRRIPVDFEHASEKDPNQGEIAAIGAPAQGWILDLDNRGAAGLWALVDWLPLARQYIQAGQYKYCSPAIRFNSKDRVTGKPIGARMTSLGLTNTPFLDGMQSIAAKDFEADAPVGEAHADADSVELDGNGLAYSDNEIYPQLRYALGVGDLATSEEMLDRIDRLEELCDQAGGDGCATIEGIDLSRYVCELRYLFKAAIDTTLSELFERARNLLSSSDDDTADAADLADKAEETLPMAEQTISLKDHEESISKLTLQLKDQEAKVATAALQLKDAESRVAAAEAETKRLLGEIEKRDTAVFDARISEAFETYGESRKLTDNDKKAMSIVLKADAATFDALYPRVTADKRPLLTKMSDKPVGGAPGLSLVAGQTREIPDIRELTDKYMREDKLTLEQATNKAYTEVARLAG